MARDVYNAVLKLDPINPFVQGFAEDIGVKALQDNVCVLTTSEYGWSADIMCFIMAQSLRDNPITLVLGL